MSDIPTIAKVVPVFTVKLHENGAKIDRLFGTGFFIDNLGNFLTAKHVLDRASHHKDQTADLRIGLGVVSNEGKGDKLHFTELVSSEDMPAPHDVALGHVNYQCEAKWAWSPADDFRVHPWLDVATYGYPLNVIRTEEEVGSFVYGLRYQKGYVQRLTTPIEMHTGKHPSGFELSFLVGQGTSGSPLFYDFYDGSRLIGVCVASYGSEHEEDSSVVFTEDGKEIRERRLKIEQYGFAHDIRPLGDFKPKLLNGKSLREAVGWHKVNQDGGTPV